MATRFMALSSSRARAALPLTALALALASNYFFTGEWFSRFGYLDPNVWTWKQSLATALLVAAIALAFFGFGRGDDFPAGSIGSPPTLARLRWWWFLPSAGLYLASNALYVLRGETPLVRWLWLAAVLALLAPLLRSLDWRDLWPMPLWEYLCLLALLSLAFALRYVYLSDLPFHADNDVAIMGYYSRELVIKGDNRWIGMAASEHQFSEHQILALSMRIFGLSHEGLVLFSVLAGTATVGVVHGIGRVCFNRWVGLIAAAVLAFNHVHIHFSRIVFGPIATCFLALACLFCALGFRRGCPGSFALAGVFTGAGLLDYYSGRVGIVVLGLALVAYVGWERTETLARRIQLAILALAGAGAAFGPNLTYAVLESSKFHGRGSSVILWHEAAWQHATYSYGGGWETVLLKQVQRTLLSPFFFPDSGGICHLTEPMLGSVAGWLFVLGLGFLLRRWRVLSGLYLLAWLGLTLLCGGILTIDPPFWPHLNVCVPAMALIAGVGGERFLRRFVSERHPISRAALPLLLAGALLASGVQNFVIYFDFAIKHISKRVLAMREIEDLGGIYRVVIVSSVTHWGHASFQFFCPGTEGADIAPAELATRPPDVSKPTAFFLFPDAGPECRAALQKRYPYALIEDFRDAWNTHMFTMVRVLPEGTTAKVRRTALPESNRTFPGWPHIFCLALLLLTPAFLLYRREGHPAPST